MVSVLHVLTFALLYLQMTEAYRPRRIGFMAMPTGTVNVSHGGTIPFRTVITNAGGAYNRGTSTFRAPVRGLYYFSLSIGMPTPSLSDDYFRVKIMKNNNKPVSYIFIGPSGKWEMRSESIVLFLKKGDCINVKIWTAAKHFSVIAGGYYHTHFSGFLIN